MSRAHRKLTALITGAAVLFSALSPAMASMLFAGRPDILARVLSLPAAGEVDRVCQHDAATLAHHALTDTSPDDATEHAGHGIFCSFCLASGAVVSVAATAPPAVQLVKRGAEKVRLRQNLPRLLSPCSTQRSRAPPSPF